MTNPWLEIPLLDYESHISLPAVAQADMMANEFGEVLRRFSPQSVALIGCAGGNGFDRIPPETRRVLGVDINPDYVAAASSRYLGRIPGLEFQVADIQSGPLPGDPVDLIYVALVFEYVSPPAALANLALLCRPGGRLVAVLQQPSETLQAVTPSPYQSIQSLVPLMRLIPPQELAACATTCGFVLEAEKSLQLASGKRFVTQVYRRLE